MTDETGPTEPTEPKSSTLGRYHLRYLVAQGGMASVYLAQLPGPHGFEKWVAIKVIHPHLARSKRFVGMFLTEAKVAARINHPNVCSVLDFGVDEDRKLPYLVMEYLHGETFSNALRRLRKVSTGAPHRVVAKIVADAARGLHAAHELKKPNGELFGIVHRDISPQNILILYDGVSKVLDFGVARLRDHSVHTKDDEIKGKLAYMSPEQFRNEELDRRSDIWALGVVLWEATVGRPLFEAKGQGALVYSVLEQELTRPSSASAGYAPELERIVMTALERDLDKRYPSAAALAADLERYLYTSDQPVGPEQVGGWMSGLFSDRLAARNELLRSEAEIVDVVPEIDLGRETTQEVEVGQAKADAAAAEGLPKRSRTPLMLGLIALLVVAGFAALILAVGPWGRDGADRRDGGDQLAKVAPRSSPDASPTREAGPAPADAGPTKEAGPTKDATPAPDGAPRSDGAPAATDGGPPRDTVRDVDAGERREAGPPGKLSLLAIPAAEVYAGSKKLGLTPLFNVELRPGTYRLHLTPIGGGPRKTIVVKIRPGEIVRRSVRL